MLTAAAEPDVALPYKYPHAFRAECNVVCCLQEHPIQAPRAWTQTPNFTIKDLQASLGQAGHLVASQAAVPWTALQVSSTLAPTQCTCLYAFASLRGLHTFQGGWCLLSL